MLLAPAWRDNYPLTPLPGITAAEGRFCTLGSPFWSSTARRFLAGGVAILSAKVCRSGNFLLSVFEKG